MITAPLPSDVRRALEAVRTGDKHQYGPGVRTGWREHAEVLAAALETAKAEALRDAADHIETVVRTAEPHRAFTEHVLAENGGPGYLRELANEYERDAR